MILQYILQAIYYLALTGAWFTYIFVLIANYFHTNFIYNFGQKPLHYGSGGSVTPGVKSSGGGIIFLKAHNYMEIDGSVLAYGMDALNYGAGGGAGGSILLEAPHFSGRCQIQQEFV